MEGTVNGRSIDNITYDICCPYRTFKKTKDEEWEAFCIYANNCPKKYFTYDVSGMPVDLCRL